MSRKTLSSEQRKKLNSLRIKPVRGIRGYSTFTTKEADKIRDFQREENVSASQIARHLDVCPEVVMSAVNREHSHTRIWSKVMTIKEGAEIVKMHLSGMKPRSIADQLRVKHNKIYYWVAKHKTKPYLFTEYLKK